MDEGGPTMGSHPINLAVRFLLELGAFGGLAFWGWQQSEGLLSFVFAAGAFLIAAILWGTFNVPDDPSRSGKAPVRVPGLVRLLLELAIFAAGIWAIQAAGYEQFALIMAILVIVHYVLSYDRIAWLLRQ
jgi:hypothetical protein